MNRVTDAEILKVLKEQINLEKMEDNILGIFTYGKVNYGMADTIADIECLPLIVPTTFEDLCIFSDTINDIRNPNINSEIFFSKYKILNPKYENIYNQYMDEKDVRKSIVKIIEYAINNNKEIKEVNFTTTEKTAYTFLLQELGQEKEGNISISQLVEKTPISRPVYTNLLQKINDSGIAKVIKQGVKGTYIKIYKEVI